MWHELKTSVDFKFSSRVWCSMREKISFASSSWEMRKNVFNLALASRECRAEVVSASPCGTDNCERCWVEDIISLSIVSRLDFHSRETGMIDFLQLRGSKQRVIPCSLAISRHSQCSNWKHFSSRAQWRFLSCMEHQTFGKNLKSTQVLNLCRVTSLRFIVLWCKHSYYIRYVNCKVAS